MKALILLLLLTGCASTKNKVQEQKNEKSTLETKTRVKIIDTSTFNVIEFVPVNDTLPFTVNGKLFKNVKIRQSKTKNNISIDKEEKVAYKAKKAVNIERKVKEVKQFNWFWLLLLLIPIYFLIIINNKGSIK